MSFEEVGREKKAKVEEVKLNDEGRIQKKPARIGGKQRSLPLLLTIQSRT